MFIYFLIQSFICVCVLLSFTSLHKCHSQGIFVTRVQPEGPASQILQPGDKIIQVSPRTRYPGRCFVFFVLLFANVQLKTPPSLPGERLQLCEHRSRQRGRPPEDVSKHCGIDCRPRPASVVVSGDLQQGGAEARVGTDGQRKFEADSHIFFYGRRLDLWRAVGTIYRGGLRGLHPAGGDRPLRGADQSAAAASTSPQKANTVVYIFFYTKGS